MTETIQIELDMSQPPTAKN